MVYARRILKLKRAVGLIDFLQVRLTISRRVSPLSGWSSDNQSISTTHTGRPATRQPNIMRSGGVGGCRTTFEGRV